MLTFENETYQIIGICIEVHKELGFGFSEIVYKDALEIEAGINDIPAQREKRLDVVYNKNVLPHKYFADFVVFENVVVEIKSSPDGIVDRHISQTLNYLKASGSKVGLIVNFGKRKLEFKRLIL